MGTRPAERRERPGWPDGFRVYLVLRPVGLSVALIADLPRLAQARLPGGVVAVCLAMALWTGISAWCYASTKRRKNWVYPADLAVALALILLWRPVFGTDTLTLAPVWTIGAAVPVALWCSWRLGALAAAGLAVAELLLSPGADLGLVGAKLAQVLLVGGFGYLVHAVNAAEAQRAASAAESAALAERQRIARAVHDGVLQVLAMVAREGPGLGPKGDRLAIAARDQEAALRALLVEPATGGSGGAADGADLAAMLHRHARGRVSVSTPAGAVMIDSARAAEIDAAVAEALGNVSRHAGPGAQAWVLLEVEDDTILVSIRDNGVGGCEQEFRAAFRRGRLGMTHSIYGRLAELGGEARLRTAPARGVEWEFRVPLR